MDPAAHKFGPRTVEGRISEESRASTDGHTPTGITPLDYRLRQIPNDTTFEPHYSIGDLAKQWRLGRETVRLLVKDEPGVLKLRMGCRRTLTRYSVPESVARRVHTKLFHPAR
jgi:hypothetical protein